MTDADRLKKARWVLVSRRRMGMVLLVKWKDPTDGEVYPQGQALCILSARNLKPRAKGAKP